LLRERGGEVMVVGRRLGPVTAVAARTGAVPVAGDAASPADCERILATALDRWGRVDSLIASAGSGNFVDVEGTTDVEWARVMRTNLESAFVPSRTLLPALRQSRGSIVLVSSVAGVLAPAHAAAYVASKHALIGLGRSLAVDAGPAGVRTNVVCPWLTRTDMSDEVMGQLGARHGGDAESSYAKAARLSPSRRVLEASDVAEVIAFLASPRSIAVNGAVVMADGGMTAYDLSVTAMVDG
jgi:NAD(P)-dependent dehydrogenase (short-subunit alcohol dehydrogenase family)